MASNVEFIDFVCEQIAYDWEITSKKMFGEYMIYINKKPILLICDNTVYVKMLDCIAEKMKNAQTGFPYQGAKLHYVLDIDNADFAKEIISTLEPVTQIPKPRKKKTDN